MRVIRALIIILVVPLLTFGCVERFYPEEGDIFAGTLVVSAHLTQQQGTQVISISRSDKLIYPIYKPESNCLVLVENLDGEVQEFLETVPGDYMSELSSDFLKFGMSYKLSLVTPDGNRYESEYTKLHQSTRIDSLYYERETQSTTDPDQNIEGIRFFMDFEVDPDSSRFLRWELEETYEFHNPDYEGLIYSYDRILKPIPDSLSDRQCWINGYVNAIFTLDAGNFSSREFTYMPLHFISNETQRLSYGYSLLVRQYSMAEAAFRYWDELKKNSQEMSGMYDRQPSLTPSNICNVENPDEKILGFFSVSGIMEKRIFVKDVEGLEKYDVLFCLPYPEMPRLRYTTTSELPIYVSIAKNPTTGETIRGETVVECLDCRVRKGSSGDPPDFWPLE